MAFAGRGEAAMYGDSSEAKVEGTWMQLLLESLFGFAFIMNRQIGVE